MILIQVTDGELLGKKKKKALDKVCFDNWSFHSSSQVLVYENEIQGILTSFHIYFLASMASHQCLKSRIQSYSHVLHVD